MWQAHITVAAIIEHNQRFILVSDKTATGIKLNQPAGHLDPNETILEAVIRETKEETSLDFIPDKIVGIYMLPANDDTTYIRFCFKGHLKDYTVQPQPSADDQDVVKAAWYSMEEIMEQKTNHRSEVVERCFIDYLAGNEYPLELITNFSTKK